MSSRQKTISALEAKIKVAVKLRDGLSAVSERDSTSKEIAQDQETLKAQIRNEALELHQQGKNEFAVMPSLPLLAKALKLWQR